MSTHIPRTGETLTSEYSRRPTAAADPERDSDGLTEEGMRQLEASITTFNLDRVKVSLTRLGVTRLKVSEAQLPATGASGAAAFLPRIRVQVTVPDEVADQAAELLAGRSEERRVGKGCRAEWRGW